MGLGEIMSSQEAVFKLEGTGDSGGDGFGLWASLNRYPVGSALEALAMVTQPSDSASALGIEPFMIVSELNSALGDSLITLDIMRLAYTWSPGDFSITLGRQSFLTGYGYGWNPMDLVSPLKDPSDPEADMRGVDGISVGWDSGAPVALKLYSLYNSGGTGIDSLEDLKAGGEAVLYLPSTELKISALWGKEEEGGDVRPNGIGAGFILDILGAGLYAEGALRQYSRTGVPVVSGTGEEAEYAVSQGDEWCLSALGGLEYYLPSGTALIGEYFYNGEGMDGDERKIYADALDSFGVSGSVPLSLSSLYRFGFFAEHYFLLNILHSLWYPFQIDLNMTLVGSPDSASLSTAGSVTFYPSGNLSFDLGYGGFFSMDDGEYGEAWLSPFGHMVYLSASWKF